MRRLALLAGLWAACSCSAADAGVVMLSAATATEGRLEAGLPFPDGSRLAVESIARASRALGARDAQIIVWFGDHAERLDEMPAERRVIFHCLSHDSEIYERDRALTVPAPALDPAAWVAGGSGRLVWWPALPEPGACGLPVALLVAAPASIDFGDTPLGTTAQRDAVLSNAGRIELDLQSIGVTGSGFSLLQDPCSHRQLSPGQTCTLRVGFTPAGATPHTGHLTLPNSGMDPQAQLALAGSGLAPAQLHLDPAALAFGDVAIGITPRRTVTVSNTGGEPLPLGTMDITGTGFIIVFNACNGVTLAPAQSCAIEIQFAPATATTFTGNLHVARADSGAAGDVALSGRGLVPAQIVADPAALAFGDLVVGTTLRRTVTVSNGGEASLPLGTMSVSGAGFAIAATECNGVTLGAAQTCTIAIDFTPNAAATFDSTLRIARSDAATPLDVGLSGRGLVAALISLDPATLAFGDVVLGDTMRRTVTVGNVGEAPLPLGTATLTGEGFAIFDDGCAGRTLAAEQECAIAIDFAPAAASDHAGSLHIARTDAGATADVALSGRGLAPALLQVEPAALAFADTVIGATLRRSVTVRNGGDAALALGTMNIAGDGFAIASNDCDDATLDGGHSCSIAVEFTPATAAGHAGTLTVIRAGAGAPVAVALSGAGLAPAQLQADPVALAFGEVVVGDTLGLEVTVRNTGDAPITLGAANATGGDFALGANDCNGATLAAAQACSITADFAPAAPGQQSGMLTLIDANAGTALQIALSGRGLAPAQLTLEPAIVPFGDVVVGSTLRRTVVAGNGGEALLAIASVGVQGDGFAIVSEACSGDSLGAPDSCAVEIEFAPAAAGSHGGLLTFVIGQDAESIMMSGTGIVAPPAGPLIFRSGFE